MNKGEVKDCSPKMARKLITKLRSNNKRGLVSKTSIAANERAEMPSYLIPKCEATSPSETMITARKTEGVKPDKYA